MIASSSDGGRPVPCASDEASVSTGLLPGVNSSHDQRRGSSMPSIAGTRPARSSDDLPEPDAPTTATGPSRRGSPSRSTSVAVSCSRPKKYCALPTENDSRPG
jgi:hypothetical protein